MKEARWKTTALRTVTNGDQPWLQGQLEHQSALGTVRSWREHFSAGLRHSSSHPCEAQILPNVPWSKWSLQEWPE